MNRCEKALIVILRVSAVVLLVALIPAVIPFTRMQEIHRRLGMGELPDQPIVGYLTRSLSALYALHGALVLFISLDVRSYLPLVRCFGVLGIVFGLGMLVLDAMVGMPAPWTACEGPSVAILGAALLWLASCCRDGKDGPGAGVSP